MSSIVLPDLHAPLAAWVDLYASLTLKIFPCRGKQPLFPSAHPPGDPPGEISDSGADIRHGTPCRDPDRIKRRIGRFLRFTFGPHQPIRATGTHDRRDAPPSDGVDLFGAE